MIDGPVIWCVCYMMSCSVQVRQVSFTAMVQRHDHQLSHTTMTCVIWSGEQAVVWYTTTPVTSTMTRMTSVSARRCALVDQYTHTHTHTTIYGSLSGTTRVSWYHRKHSSTHTFPAHQPSFISFLYLPQSIASSLLHLHA